MAHRLHVYVSDDTLARLEAQRGPTPRSAWVVHLIDTHAGPDTVDLMVDGRTVRAVPDEAPPLQPPRGAEPPQHTHTWKRNGTYLDICRCGETRPHMAGTR